MDFSRAEAMREQAEPEIRRRLEEHESMAARLSEQVDVPTGTIRRKLTKEERAAAIALNVTLDVVARHAHRASEQRDPSWQGLADAQTLIENELSHRQLPVLSPFVVEQHRALEEGDQGLR